MPRPGETIAGKYRIESLIGEGGMGAVFSATHTLTGKRVALKWMLPDAASSDEAVQRLLREASATGRIGHPSVVDVYDVGEHQGSPFLVMELLHGETLSNALDRRALSVPEILRCVLGAIEGIAAAHDKGVIHRDIKPENIFLCRDEAGAWATTKVLDFGISKISSGQSSASMRLTKTGAVIGTPYYMSPEQIRGAADVDHRADVYALGVILYEALTGRVPFDGSTYSALVLEIATGTPASLCELNPHLPVALEHIVMKAMARDPAKRFADVRSLGAALERFLSEGDAQLSALSSASRSSSAQTTPMTAPATSIPPPVPVQRTPLYAALAMGALLLGGLASWLQRDDDVQAKADAFVARPASEPQVAAGPAPTHQGLGETADGGAPEATTEATRELAAQPAQATATNESSRSAAAAKPAPERPRPTAARRETRASEPPPAPPPAPPAPIVRPAATGRSGALSADEF